MLAGALLAATQTSAHAFTAAQVDKSVTVTGAGATFPLNMIEQWKADFKKSTGVTINYTGVGSGAGRTQLINGTVDFAGSDVLASTDEVNKLKAKYKGGFVYVPEIGGAIGITYNVQGVPPGIKLTASDIAKIFDGKVAYWDDDLFTTNNPCRSSFGPTSRAPRATSPPTSTAPRRTTGATAPPSSSRPATSRSASRAPTAWPTPSRPATVASPTPRSASSRSGPSRWRG
jgi:ABC-type phosphate transport system substrate-binding protein